jgi:HEAT repeat protein
MKVADNSYTHLLEELSVPYRATGAYRRFLAAGSDALPSVRAGLRHANADVRYHCCRFLDRFLSAEIVADLVGMLDDPDPRVRNTTLHTLACDRCKEGDCRPEEKEVLPRALALLAHDPDRHVRAMAIEVVGQFAHANPAAADALETAAKADSAPTVRKKAAWYAPGGAIYRRTA